jgi:hypothetical protein
MHNDVTRREARGELLSLWSQDFAVVSFLRRILRGEVGVLVVIRVVFRIVQATIKGIQSFPFTAFLVVKVKSRKNFERGGLISFHVGISLLQLAIESARCIFLGDVKPI